MSAGAWSSQARGVSRQRISAGGAGGCEICRCGGSGRAAVAEAPPAPHAGGLAPRGPARPRGVIRRASPAAIPRALRRLGLRRRVAFWGGAGPSGAGRGPAAHGPTSRDLGAAPRGFSGALWRAAGPWCRDTRGKGRPAPTRPWCGRARWLSWRAGVGLNAPYTSFDIWGFNSTLVLAQSCQMRREDGTLCPGEQLGGREGLSLPRFFIASFFFFIVNHHTVHPWFFM